MLSPDAATSQTNYACYVMNPANKLISQREGGRRNQSIILTYADGTEWIFLPNMQEERFCGFLYLQCAIKESGLHHVEPAENKIAIHDREIIYLSKYCGEQRPDIFKYIDIISALSKDIGFTDKPHSSNLREIDEKLYIFDTEKSSFADAVHGKIDSYVGLHGEIVAYLKKQTESSCGDITKGV